MNQALVRRFDVLAQRSHTRLLTELTWAQAIRAAAVA